MVRDRGCVARRAVPAPAQARFLQRDRRAVQPRCSRELQRVHPLLAREVEAVEPAPQLERGEQVALDVQVAGDVRPAEAEVARRGGEPAHRVGRLHDERGRRVLRAGVAAVVGLEADGEVFAEDPRDKIRNCHGHVPSVLL